MFVTGYNGRAMTALPITCGNVETPTKWLSLTTLSDHHLCTAHKEDVEQ